MIPGNAKSLWNAVKIAKDLNVDPRSSKMNQNNILLPNDDQPDQFASYCNDKIITIMNTTIDDGVYNCRKNLMTRLLKKLKRSEMMKPKQE